MILLEFFTRRISPFELDQIEFERFNYRFFSIQFHLKFEFLILNLRTLTKKR